jgi:quinohemoprotein ethanol dehydrogenase
MKRSNLLAAFATLLLAACTPSNSPDMKIGPDDWATTGGDAGKSHHSKLTDINAENVGTLGLAWQAELGTDRVLEATPIVIDGVMYTSGVAGRAYAFDAASGKQLWAFEPKVDMQVNRTVCCDMANRGVAVARGKVFVAALDAQLYALDAKTGKVLWKADTVDDKNRGINSTGAPEVAGDVVIIGNGGAEYDVRGYVSAYDLESGKLEWRFHTVPRDPKLGPQDHPDLEAAVKTWDPDSRWDIGGGGTPWDAINFDVETGLVIIGTGNGGQPQGRRSALSLFACRDRRKKRTREMALSGNPVRQLGFHSNPADDPDTVGHWRREESPSGAACTEERLSLHP